MKNFKENYKVNEETINEENSIKLIEIYCKNNNFIAAKNEVSFLTSQLDAYLAMDTIYSYCIPRIKYLLENKLYEESELLCLEFRENKYVESMLVTTYLRVDKLYEAKTICDENAGNQIFDTRIPIIKKKLFKKIVHLIKKGDFEEAKKNCYGNEEDSGIMFLLAKIYYFEKDLDKAKEVLIKFQDDKRHIDLLKTVYKTYSVMIKTLIEERKYNQALKIAECNIENEIIKSQYVTLLIKKRRLDEAICLCNENISSPVFISQLNKIYFIIANVIEDLFTDNKDDEAIEMLIKYQHAEEVKILFPSYFSNQSIDCLSKNWHLLKKLDKANNLNEDIVNKILSTNEVEQLIYKGYFYKKCNMSEDLINLKIHLNTTTEEYYEVINRLYLLLEEDVTNQEDFLELLIEVEKIESVKESNTSKKRILD